MKSFKPYQIVRCTLRVEPYGTNARMRLPCARSEKPSNSLQRARLTAETHTKQEERCPRAVLYVLGKRLLPLRPFLPNRALGVGYSGVLPNCSGVPNSCASSHAGPSHAGFRSCAAAGKLSPLCPESGAAFGTSPSRSAFCWAGRSAQACSSSAAQAPEDKEGRARHLARARVPITRQCS